MYNGHWTFIIQCCSHRLLYSSFFLERYQRWKGYIYDFMGCGVHILHVQHLFLCLLGGGGDGSYVFMNRILDQNTPAGFNGGGGGMPCKFHHTQSSQLFIIITIYPYFTLVMSFP